MRTIKASEIGAFLYCRRAWWYQQQGLESQNQAELTAGSAFHQQHGRQVALAGILRGLGWILLLAAVLVLTVGLVIWLTP